ncbi:MAG: 50S ribosomal protein L9 [Geobacteraceae bacterium]|nr:50S ribosomal protein L9 [Geobacteraceae bacterium]
MKIILLENVENLGHIGDIVKVAPGYARNYLLPKGFAMLANEKNTKALEHAKRQLEYKKNKMLEQAKAIAAKIEGIVLNLVHAAGEEGKLFGSVTNMELAEHLKAQGLEIDRKKIVLVDPIKQLGEYSVTVKVQPEVLATFKVIVSKAE